MPPCASGVTILKARKGHALACAEPDEGRPIRAAAVSCLEESQGTLSYLCVGIYHFRLLYDSYLSYLYFTVRSDHLTENLLSRRFNTLVPALPASDCNFFFTGCQTFIRLIGELIKRYADWPFPLEVWLVLFIVELGCC